MMTMRWTRTWSLLYSVVVAKTGKDRMHLSGQDGLAVRAGGIDELTGCGNWLSVADAGFCNKSR